MTYKRNINGINRDFCDICNHDITRFNGICMLHGTHEQQEQYLNSLKNSKNEKRILGRKY